MEEKLLQWQAEHRVDTASADWTGLASVRFLCGAMQDTGSRHADALGYGPDDMQRMGIIWVLARLQLRMIRYPLWSDTMSLQTWFAKKGRLMFHRDFRFDNAAGEYLGGATTAWVAFDIKLHRPVRVDALDEEHLHKAVPRAVSEPWRKLPTIESKQYERTFPVFASHLDMSGHVNNASFPDWLLEPLPMEFRAAHHLAAFDIAYQSEAFHANELALQLEPIDENRFIHQITRPSDNTVICTACSTWVRRDHPRSSGWQVKS